MEDDLACSVYTVLLTHSILDSSGPVLDVVGKHRTWLDSLEGGFSERSEASWGPWQRRQPLP